MKTIEQKAKAYDEALKRAKSMIDDLRKGEDILAISDLESMFPELKESKDERIRKELIGFIYDVYNKGSLVLNDEHKDKWIAWLEKKELKKIEQKSAWSEDDDRMLHTIIADFKSFSHNNTSTLEPHFKECIDWLKSIKGRYTWFPSEEQIKALSNINLTGCISYTGQGQELINLYNDLKKLKGE